jgi:cyanophycinase
MNKRIEILKMALKGLSKDLESDRLEAIETKVHPGAVIAIGGAEDKTYHGKILNRVFELAGGKGIDITIIPWASEKKDAGEIYEKIFKHLGAKDVFLLKEKNRKKSLKALEYSALIFFVGGDQKRLLDALEDLDLISEIQRYNGKGSVVAGTSAGASILGEHMPYYSEKEDKVLYYRGLDLVPNSIIDQHFSQRHRIKRLQDAVERFKGITGYGIDEDTAIGFQDGVETFQMGSGRIKILPEKD